MTEGFCKAQKCMLKTMELTKNSITDIISTGTVNNSTLANLFISYVEKTYGITVAACYCDAYKTVEFSKKIKHGDKLSSNDVKWINSLTLQIYLKNYVQQTVELENILMNAFEHCIDVSGLTIDYVRSYTPDELAYYGWNKKNRSEWDNSIVVTPCNEPIERKTVIVESFDNLVVWHCMSKSLKKMNAAKSITDISAKVYCGWDENKKSMNLYVIVPEVQFKSLDLTKKQKITDELSIILISHDKFNVFKNIKLQPNYTIWTNLPNELRFALLRDEI